MDNEQIISLLSIIGVSTTAIATCVACYISYKSTKLIKEQLLTSCINQCNERYCNIIRNINKTIMEKNKEGFILNCYDLFELFCHQFILWKNNLLPNEIFLTWAYYNSRQIRIYNYNDDNINIDVYQLWNEAKNNNKFYQDSNFIIYMKHVFDKDIELIPKLKDKKMNIKNIDYRI